MYLHEKPIVTQIRVYSEPDGYENKIPYDAIMTVQYVSDSTAYVEGLQGKINIRVIKELVKILKDNGVRGFWYTRDTELKYAELS